MTKNQPGNGNLETWQVSPWLGLGVGTKKEVYRPGWFPHVACLVDFFAWFLMDFIGLLVPLGWSLRGWSGFFPSRFSRGLFFYFRGAKLGTCVVSSVSQILVCGSGMRFVGNRHWFWSLLYGGTLICKREAGHAQLCYIDTLIHCLALIDAMSFVL